MFEQDFVNSIFNFAMTFNSMNLSDDEVGLFVAVVLLTADRPGVADPKLVEHYQDKVIEALRIQVRNYH
ncbi:Ecdysone-induced protein 78C [Armadillidium vulgare]|nr:Ecdysone-induced protein 78C [Armadillidium vulgare]